MTDKKDIEFLVEEKKLEEVSNILNEVRGKLML